MTLLPSATMVNDAGCSVLYELKLLLGRIAQGIAAQRDDNTLSI